jgi:hypothetical protein
MRTLIAAALVVGLVGLGGAQDKKVADPTGTWKCETDVMGQKRESTLRLKTDGGKLTGTVTWQDKAESKVENAKFKDGELTYSVKRELMDQTFTINYKLKVEGDTLKGKAEADFGGETRSFDVEGKREKDKK